MSVLSKPRKIASHAPPELSRGLGRNEPSVALRASNDDGITNAIEAIARAFTPEEGRVELQRYGLRQI